MRRYPIHYSQQTALRLFSHEREKVWGVIGDALEHKVCNFLVLWLNSTLLPFFVQNPEL